jgi:hypothetical protein
MLEYGESKKVTNSFFNRLVGGLAVTSPDMPSDQECGTFAKKIDLDI